MFLACAAGLVGLVVLRDVALVVGAAYHRASSLSWKVSLTDLNLVFTLFLLPCVHNEFSLRLKFTWCR